ncbi:MAG: sugar phosphate isomerase/epimerase [Thermoguttaceae bacterium]|nr:sugar phosphate isomerase/epimerase [Thermoguttaceae bacterium]
MHFDWVDPKAALHRRAFLGAGAAAAVFGFAAGRRCVVAADQRWAMRLSASSINFSRLPIEAACERIAALGFEAIDIWSAHAGCPHLDDVQKRLGPEGLKELLAKHRLKLYAFSVYAGGYPRYAELLGKAGGGVAIRGSAGPCEPAEMVPRMKAFLESLKPELELAEKYNSYLAIENHGHALLHTIDSMKAFVDLNKHPRLGIALAPYHVQAGQERVEEAIAACGPQLLFFYAWQHAPGVQELPGHGPTDFTPWIAALAKANYRGYVNPFMHNEPPPEAMSTALAKSRDYLKQCYAKAIG